MLDKKNHKFLGKPNFLSKTPITNDYSADDWTESTMERHDKHNFEAKIVYNVKNKTSKNQFLLTIYHFIPRSLQVKSSTYSRESFFADLNNNMRFKTPKMAFSGILNDENELSPLFRINKYVQEIMNGVLDSLIINKIVYELRLLGCMIRSNVRKQVSYFLKELSKISDLDEINEDMLIFLQEIKFIIQKIRMLNHKFKNPNVPDEIRTAYSYIEIYASLQIQENITKILKKIQDDHSCNEICSIIVEIINGEVKHRTVMDSRMIKKPNDSNEEFSYWEGIFKKYTQKVLYLEKKVKDDEGTSGFTQFMFSLAAGTAMFFSLLVGVLVANFYPINSFPFILALVVAYMFKDRIKEGLRYLSNKIMVSKFPDRKYQIIDDIKGHTKEVLGTVKEKVTFVSWNDVPEEILSKRQSTGGSIAQEGKPERVLRYIKDLKIDIDKINSIHDRHDDIMDIIRFNIRNFIQYADDILRHEDYWDVENQQIQQTTCVKVYHLNVIMKIDARDEFQNQSISYKKYRIILDQKGIKRVVEISKQLKKE